jgi:hypothetical protein
LFHRSYNDLAEPQQEQINRAIRRLCQNPRPPFPKGWRVHKLAGVKGTPEKQGDPPPDVWEMHAPGSGALLVTFQYGNQEILFRNCGPHDKTLLNP